MSVAYVDSPMTWDDILRTWRELEVPEGWRPELTVEGISMTPPPGGTHNLIAASINRQLLPAVPDGCDVFQTLGVGVRQAGGIYVPDVCVVPRAAVPPGPDPVHSADVLIAVEITSPGNAEHDRKKKKWAYAHGDIPCYLLIDPYDEDGASASLFTQPIGGVYSTTNRTAFGRSVVLNEPFGVDLSTAEF